MGLVSKDPNKGWGGNSDRCVITGAEATGTSRTLFGGRVKTGEAINGESSSVPTREDADRLASELPADRTDGTADRWATSTGGSTGCGSPGTTAGSTRTGTRATGRPSSVPTT